MELEVTTLKEGKFVSSYDVFKKLKPIKTDYTTWVDSWYKKLEMGYCFVEGKFLNRLKKNNYFIPFKFAIELCKKSNSRVAKEVIYFLKGEIQKEIELGADCNYQFPFYDPDELANFLEESAAKRKAILDDIIQTNKLIRVYSDDLIWFEKLLEVHDKHFLELTRQKVNPLLERMGFTY